MPTMTAFKLSEISLVRKPAQEGALALFSKRDYTADERRQMAESGEAMESGAFPIADRADLEDAIKDVPRADDPDKARAHVVARAKALDATDALPPEWKVADAGDDDDDDDDDEDDPQSAKAMLRKGEAILKAQGMADPLAPGYGEIGGADSGIVGATKPGYGETMAGAGRPAGDAGTADRWPDHPQRDLDWKNAKAKALDGLDAMAKERHRKDRTKSVEKHYSEILKEPGGADLYALAR